jgi:hypothetical protein
MSELLHGDHEAFRRALHAAAEQVEPAGDGLDRIQARVSHRRPMPWPLAWVDVALTRLSLRIPDGVWSVWDKVALQLQTALDRFLPAPARAMSGRLRLGWVRPVAAMSVAVFIVAAVVSMAIEVPQYVSPQAATGPQSSGDGGSARTGGSSGAPGQSQANSGSRSSSGGPNQTSGAPNHTSCTTTPPTINPAPSTTSPSSSSPTSPSPSSPTSPSPSSSPTPSTSDTGSTAPSGVGDSPETGSGDTAPSVAPDSDTARDQSAVKSADATSHAKPIHSTTRKSAASDASTPCSSPKKKPKPTSSVKVSPDAAGSVLFLWAGSAGLAAAEVSARIY